ncbi:MAG: PAS domain-containing protein [Alphaproteobacteria bacterium]|nr:PAS domain-containing protein [Alphaproteobacteria bacterium]
MAEKHDLVDGEPPATLDFHKVFAKVPTQLMVMDRELAIVYANEAYLRTTMRPLSDIQGRYVFDAFPESPSRMALFKAAFERALSGEENVLTTEAFAVPAPGFDGGMKNIVWTCSHTPITDGSGRVAYVLQNAVDVTADYELDRHNETLLSEFNHRVKNTLATVQAIARQSLTDGKPMREARDDFLARIQAMSVVHDLVLAENCSGTDLVALLAQALKPFGYEDGAGRPVALRGPAVPITARQAQTLSMAIHELATNAAKYGALSNRDGSVDVEWSHEPSRDGAFRLVWRERDGPGVDPPHRKGFGTAMLTRVLAQEIGGRVEIDFLPEGVVCRMQGRLAKSAE